jgi:hypothetical protein
MVYDVRAYVPREMAMRPMRPQSQEILKESMKREEMAGR